MSGLFSRVYVVFFPQGRSVCYSRVSQTSGYFKLTHIGNFWDFFFGGGGGLGRIIILTLSLTLLNVFELEM